MTARQKNLPMNEWKEMREMISTQESGFNQNCLRTNFFQRRRGCVKTIYLTAAKSEVLTLAAHQCQWEILENTDAWVPPPRDSDLINLEHAGPQGFL